MNSHKSITCWDIDEEFSLTIDVDRLKVPPFCVDKDSFWRGSKTEDCSFYVYRVVQTISNQGYFRIPYHYGCLYKISIEGDENDETVKFKFTVGGSTRTIKHGYGQYCTWTVKQFNHFLKSIKGFPIDNFYLQEVGLVFEKPLYDNFLIKRYGYQTGMDIWKFTYDGYRHYYQGTFYRNESGILLEYSIPLDKMVIIERTLQKWIVHHRKVKLSVKIIERYVLNWLWKPHGIMFRKSYKNMLINIRQIHL